ncbi:MAG: hypothetical protein WB679_15630 [Terracidiphilus sp.]
MKLSKASLAVLVIQLLLISSIAAKYVYERSISPRVWTRASMYDPSLIMRGRYLSTQLTVDGCQSTLPSAKQAGFPRNLDGVPNGRDFSIAAMQPIVFPAKLAVSGNRLVAIRIPDTDDVSAGQNVIAMSGASCDQMHLSEAVNFYLAEHATSPLPVKTGQELWVEVTVPPQGPPRPIQLALKDHGAWKPLAFQ